MNSLTEISIVYGTLVTTDPAAKQILLHINESRYEATKAAFEFEKRAAAVGMTGSSGRAHREKEQFVVADLDATHMVIKTDLVTEIKNEFQQELEAFTYKQVEDVVLGGVKK